MAMRDPQQSDRDNKSEVRKAIEHKTKQKSGKMGKKLLKKLGKKGAKLAAKASLKVGLLFVKAFFAIVGYIGVPLFLIMFGIMVLALIISLVSSFMFSSGDGLEGEEKELHEYIVEQSEATVDMSNPTEVPYKVPVELISAVIMLDVMKGEDQKEVVKTMAEDLAPTFTYEKFNEYKETQTQECVENDCDDWSDIEKRNNYVQKLTLVDYWSGQTNFNYESYKTEWEVKEETKVTRKDGVVKTKTRTRKQKFRSTENTTSDYFTFDQILNSHDLGINDKRLIQENFLIAGGQMNYINWLEGNTGFGGGSYPGFNGTITPGSSVPAEFMEHYLSAEKEYGVDWYVLAALHFVETAFSTHPTMISSAGAIGHVQFLPASWVGWKYDVGGGSVPASLDITSLSTISSGGGYGVDANGDGKADPWDVADAIHTAANYLSKSGYSSDKRSAIFNYNRADWYVDKVMNNAQKFKDEAVYSPADGVPASGEGLMKPTKAAVTSIYGWRFHPIYHEMRLHSGIDLAAVGMVPIVASADGVVAASKYSNGLGHQVWIDHSIDGQYVQTIYGHMRGRNVRVGQTVSQGDFLGYMGSTGSSTAQHLHFEIHIGGSYNASRSFSVDPAKYINF